MGDQALSSIVEAAERGDPVPPLKVFTNSFLLVIGEPVGHRVFQDRFEEALTQASVEDRATRRVDKTALWADVSARVAERMPSVAQGLAAGSSDGLCFVDFTRLD